MTIDIYFYTTNPLVTQVRNFILVFFTDLVTGVVCVLTDIIWKSLVIWYGGNIGCKIIRFLQVKLLMPINYEILRVWPLALIIYFLEVLCALLYTAIGNKTYVSFRYSILPLCVSAVNHMFHLGTVLYVLLMLALNHMLNVGTVFYFMCFFGCKAHVSCEYCRYCAFYISVFYLCGF